MAASAGTRRRSTVMRRASLLRLGLLVAAVGLVAATLLWSMTSPQDGHLRVDSVESTTEPQTSPGDAMTAVTYSGIDKKGRLFSLSAERISQQDETAKTMNLSRPDARLSLADGSAVTVVANAGVYDPTAQTMRLSGDVVLRHGEDLTVSTQSARLDLQAGAASGTDAIVGEGSFGRVEGTGFQLRDDGAFIGVGGPARLWLVPNAKVALP